VLWILGSGAEPREIPEQYPPLQTSHRRFQQWVRNGNLKEALRRLAQHLQERGRLNLDEAFVDATSASAKRRGFAVGPTRRGDGTKIVAVAAGKSLPLVISAQSASPAEYQLVEEVLPEVSSTN